MALNDNQNNFIELYLQGLNPTEISKQMHIMIGHSYFIEKTV